MKDIAIGIILLFIVGASECQTLNGFIVDSSTLKPLAYAHIQIEQSARNLMSGNNGEFYLTNLPKVPYTLLVSYIGYETKTIHLTPQDTSVLIKLNSSTFTLQEVCIYSINSSKDETLNYLNIKNEKIVQTAGFSKDAFRSLQMLAGVSGNNELSAKYNVRGGTIDENIVLLNGVRVYEPYHLRYEPLLSIGIFPIDLVDNMNFSSGGFGAKYGDGLSSVLNIDYKQGSREKISGIANISLIDVGLLLDGPINSKSSFVLGMRKDYVNYMLKMANSDPNNSLYYYDVNAQLDYQLSKSSKIRCNFIYSFDNFRYKPSTVTTYYHESVFYSNSDKLLPTNSTQNLSRDDNVDYANKLLSLQFTNRISNKIFNETTFSFYQDYNNEKKNRMDNRLRLFPVDPTFFHYIIREEKSTMELTTNTYDFQTHFKYYLSSFNSIIAGINYQNINYNYDNKGFVLRTFEYSINGFSDTTNIYDYSYTDTITSTPYTYKLGGYIEDRWQIHNKLFLNLGCRTDYFDMNRNLSVSPRISLAYQLPYGFKARAAWGIYNQSPSFRQLKYIKPWSQNTKNQKAEHYILGIKKHFKNNLEISIEGYFKNYLSLIPTKRLENTGLNYLTNVTATGYAKGIDLEVQKNYDKFSFWLSYGYLVTKERYETGNEYPRYSDQRHTLSLNCSIYLRKNWEINFKYYYGSGYAYTPSVIVYDSERQKNIWQMLGENSAHYAGYNRMDIRLSKKAKLFDNALFIYFDILNVLNNKNVYSYEYLYSLNSNPYREENVLLPIIPSIGLSYSF